MPLEMSAVMIGVEDLARSKKFYEEGLGCTIEQDYPSFVSINVGEGRSSLALYQREAAAQDAGVSPRGQGSGESRSTTSSPLLTPWTRSSPRPSRPAATW